jgi:S-adenosylmethionine synthetase
MGRKPEVVTKHFDNRYEGARDIQVELFTWEKLDYVDRIRQVFGI